TQLNTHYLGAMIVQQADMSVLAGASCPTSDPPAMVIAPPTRSYSLGPPLAGEQWPAGRRYRIAFGDLDGRLLRILIETPNDEAFQTFDPLVEAVLASIAVGTP
ncbi:MAG: hypothetical protein ACXWO7_10500, partial [Candidatus Limnocylindrales bacterium]